MQVCAQVKALPAMQEMLRASRKKMFLQAAIDAKNRPSARAEAAEVPRPRSFSFGSDASFDWYLSPAEAWAHMQGAAELEEIFSGGAAEQSRTPDSPGLETAGEAAVGTSGERTPGNRRCSHPESITLIKP